MKRDMTVGPPWKTILAFSLPIMAGNLLQQLYHTADTLIVGNMEGETALSAVGACASLTELFTALAIGFSVGAGVLCAQYYGARREEILRIVQYWRLACWSERRRTARTRVHIESM